MHHQPPTLLLVPAPCGSPQAGLGAGGAEGGQPACTPFTLLGTGQPHSAPTGSCAGPGRASGFFNAWRGGTGGDLAWLLLREEAGCGQPGWWPLAVPSPLTRTLYCSHGQGTYNSQPRSILRASGSCHYPGRVPRGWDRDTPGRAGCVQQPRGLVAAPGSSVPTQPPTATNTSPARSSQPTRSPTRDIAPICAACRRCGDTLAAGTVLVHAPTTPRLPPRTSSPPLHHGPNPLSMEQSKGLLLIFVKSLIRRLSSQGDGGDVAAGGEGGGHITAQFQTPFLFSAVLGSPGSRG